MVELGMTTSRVLAVYPKVKVGTEGEWHKYNCTSLLSLKDVPFLVLQDSCFPVKVYRDMSPPPPLIARVPKSYVSNIILPTNIDLPPESASEGSDKKSNSDRPNIEANSVPRPRAVLSSPDKNAGNRTKNRVKALQPSASKNHNVPQSRQTRCKTVGDQNSLNLRKLNNTTDTKIDLKVKKGSASTTPRRSVMASKPSSVRFRVYDNPMYFCTKGE
ncbi:uncharacterized protein [Euphorbia lathyris]|uniref:uncharacterized protein isoform X2 n=1 Tax=Euphorbia lathyris TaxID=212925 RepID=UPI003313B206